MCVCVGGGDFVIFCVSPEHLLGLNVLICTLCQVFFFFYLMFSIFKRMALLLKVNEKYFPLNLCSERIEYILFSHFE